MGISVGKIAIINGLARGGTNLAANLLAAQSGWHVSDAAVAEISCIDQFLPKDFKNRYPKKIEKNDVDNIVNVDIERFKTRCISTLVQNICPTYQSIKSNYHLDMQSYFGISAEKWGQYLVEISQVKKLNDLDEVYQHFSEIVGCGVLAHRTTAMTSYAHSFLSRSSNHYWIEIVRDPFDRAVSSRKGHAQCLTQSILQSKWQLEQIRKIEHNNFILVKYEDICKDPEQVVQAICNRVGVSLKEFNPSPLTPDMSCFYGNSSNNPDIFNQVKKDTAIYMDSIGGGGQLTTRERKLGEYILKGRAFLGVYYTLLLIADIIFQVGLVLERGAVALLSINYLSVVRETGWRKVLIRCMRRFT